MLQIQERKSRTAATVSNFGNGETVSPAEKRLGVMSDTLFFPPHAPWQIKERFRG